MRLENNQLYGILLSIKFISIVVYSYTNIYTNIFPIYNNTLRYMAYKILNFISNLLVTVTIYVTDRFPYAFSAVQVYSPLSVLSSTVKIRTLSLFVLGQDEQEFGNDQLYTGSGYANAVQFNATC